MIIKTKHEKMSTRLKEKKKDPNMEKGQRETN